MDLMRLVVRYNLHTADDLHGSWLPPQWPARHRQLARLGPAGRAVLEHWMRRQQPVEPDYRFDSRVKRLALCDGASLRRLAFYGGLAAHLPLLRQRGGPGAQMRRQAARYDRDAVEFVLDRVPQLTALALDPKPLQQRPSAAGRVLVGRGYRLLLGALAGEGDPVVQRVRRRFPRRLAALAVPALQARQEQQLHELLLLCILPERLPQWDWLF